MSKRRKNTQRVSRIHGQRKTNTFAAFPALRIAGKWLEAYTAIGEQYRIVRTDRPDELVIQFLKDV